MAADLLTDFQRLVLRAFFRQDGTEVFYLTGGAALAGYHLGHRATNDLNLFSSSADPTLGREALEAAARDLGATVEDLRTSPDFRRTLVRRGDETVVVDLVRERAAQRVVAKPVVDGIPVDPPEEILANKVCTLLSRCEVRDLVDVMFLERSGLRVEDAVESASRKDGGLTPGQLAWVLSQITFGEDARVPGGVTVGEVRAYALDLVARLSRLAFPRKR